MEALTGGLRPASAASSCIESGWVGISNMATTIFGLHHASSEAGDVIGTRSMFSTIYSCYIFGISVLHTILNPQLLDVNQGTHWTDPTLFCLSISINNTKCFHYKICTVQFDIWLQCVCCTSIFASGSHPYISPFISAQEVCACLINCCYLFTGKRTNQWE